LDHGAASASSKKKPPEVGVKSLRGRREETKESYQLLDRIVQNRKFRFLSDRPHVPAAMNPVVTALVAILTERDT
jgi:hypothetical protein